MDHWSSKNSPARALLHLSLALILIFSCAFSYTWQSLVYDELSVPISGYELQIAPGTAFTHVAKQLSNAGVLKCPTLLRWYAVLTGQAHSIQAGEYQIIPGTTPLDLLEMLVDGEVVQHSFSIIEGWNIKQMLSELQQHPKIKVTLAGLSEADIITKLGIPELHLEGLFSPDTYFFLAGTTDQEFLLRAYNSMQTKLQQAWQERDPNTILKTPYEALILASIIEKETGIKQEYAQISGVYQRRLAKRMLLQADPTVIYGLQDQLKGPLLRKHLKSKSAYNTYAKRGLPPTPIALPSIASIEAALHPAPGDSLYFVATGDGGHVFTSTLKEHNKAIGTGRRSR